MNKIYLLTIFILSYKATVRKNTIKDLTKELSKVSSICEESQKLAESSIEQTKQMIQLTKYWRRACTIEKMLREPHIIYEDDEG